MSLDLLCFIRALLLFAAWAAARRVPASKPPLSLATSPKQLKIPSATTRSNVHVATASFNRNNTPQRSRRLSPSLIDHVAADAAFSPQNAVEIDEAESDGELGEWLDGKTLIDAAAELGDLSDDAEEADRTINVALINKLPGWCRNILRV
ncbi:hypothetical protein BS47DRAFT_1343032 [Hydnum rufescens UP504]|uniref:Uncharacterized protein n=1 Tax=Hydnum rufescens UP504 TaxID=1448309 RepID=A0A9P6AYQ9_9AGAM|nr:hypothetical protein BS47DRAFT_1343032 [Hydnum rufescens UP504]